MVYRFNAAFVDSVASDLVLIHIKETIPDPVFTMTAFALWNGKDSLALRPSITNLAELQIAPGKGPNWTWSLLLDSTRVDTSWQAESLVLKAAAEAGNFQVQLCMDNGGTASCKRTVIDMVPSAAIRHRQPGVLETMTLRDRIPIYDARWRRLNGIEGRGKRVVWRSKP